MADCSQFRALTIPERVTFCVRHRLCFACLGTKHSPRDCRIGRGCGIHGCKTNHHQLLQDAIVFESAHSSYRAARPVRIPKVALGVVQFDAIGEDGDLVPINVMLDDGSDATLVRAGLMRRLGIKGTPRTLDIGGVGGVRTRIAESSLVKFSFSRWPVQLCRR